MKQIDRPKLTENVAREALMQYRDRTIEFIVPLTLAAVIDEYAVFGPKLSDRFPSFLGVSLSEYIVEVRLRRVSIVLGTALSQFGRTISWMPY